MTGLGLLDSTTYDRISMNVPELPNVSQSAIAYLMQAATELATEQDFQPTDENEMQQWMTLNSAAIVDRARELQESLFDKFHEHRQTIAKIAAAQIWGEVRRSDINCQVNKATDDALR
jgi:hypothetical protein